MWNVWNRFADFALEVLYIDFIEAGCSRKAPFKIPKPSSRKITRNEEAEMRAWAKMHGKSVRLRNVRQDNTMDRAGTLPLNLYETETVLKPVKNSLIGIERVPSESDEPPYSNEDASFSASDSDSDSKEEVDSALETMNKIRPTRLARVRTLTSRMADFLQAGM